MSLDLILPIWVLITVGVVFVGVTIGGIVTASRRAARVSWWARLAMVVLLILIALRPAIPGTTTAPSASGGLEVYFVVDTTSSMAAEDLGVELDGRPATRLDLVKSDIDEIATALTGAQFAVVTADSSALQRVPLTSDISAVQSATSVLTQEITAFSSGSSIDEPVSAMLEILSAARAENPERQRVLFYFGDGEQTVDLEPASFAPLRSFVSGGAVLGYGTDDGGRMRVFDGYSADDDQSAPLYIPDPTTGRDAVSRQDAVALESIAGELGVGLTVREPGASAASVVEGIDVSELSIAQGTTTAPREFYWIFAIPLGMLAAREAIVAWVTLTRSAPSRRPRARAADDRGAA